MPILNRDTLVDRPTLVNRGEEEDEQDTETNEELTTQTLGDGGGPTINHLVFEPGDYQIVAGANTAAVLSTGHEEGDEYEEAFINAAIQLKDLAQRGHGCRDLARFGVEKGIAEIGLTQEDIEQLSETPEPEDDDPEDEESQEDQTEDEEDGDSEEGGDEQDLEEVEDSIEEVKEEEDG